MYVNTQQNESDPSRVLGVADYRDKIETIIKEKFQGDNRKNYFITEKRKKNLSVQCQTLKVPNFYHFSPYLRTVIFYDFKMHGNNKMNTNTTISNLILTF